MFLINIWSPGLAAILLSIILPGGQVVTPGNNYFKRITLVYLNNISAMEISHLPKGLDLQAPIFV